ncbi:MAG: hypothetical protein NC833_00595 [Candidatus Omnitrophica bacterium]|nr:hypothetical protein [Candidatus Omnitrophota bacterium]
MGKIKLIVIDLDETALGGYRPYDRFPDHLSKFLDKVSEEDILWTTCTTWYPYMQDIVFKKSILKSRPIRAIGRTSMECGLYKNRKIYLDAEWNYEFLCYKVEFQRQYYDYINSFSKIISITEHFDYVFSLKFRVNKEEILENLNSDKIIKEKLKISGGNILIVADGFNDLPMIDKEVGNYFVCPENSDTEVKEKVEEICGIVSNLKIF